MYKVTAAQLFLLCAIRKTSVQAKNLSKYSWTIRHQSTLEERQKNEGGYLAHEVEELKTKISTELLGQQPLVRNFILHENDLGVSLSDCDEDMSWYTPPSGNMFNKLWVYSGEFELQEPLSDKELFILDHFIEKSY